MMMLHVYYLLADNDIHIINIFVMNDMSHA